MGLIQLEIDPMEIPSIAARFHAIQWYAKRFVEEFCEHETLDEYVAQAARDMKDASYKRDIKAAIGRMEREERRIAA